MAAALTGFTGFFLEWGLVASVEKFTGEVEFLLILHSAVGSWLGLIVHFKPRILRILLIFLLGLLLIGSRGLQVPTPYWLIS